MQNTSPRVAGRRALIKGTAMLAVAATYYQYGHDASLRALVLFGHGENFSRGMSHRRRQPRIFSSLPATVDFNDPEPVTLQAVFCSHSQERLRAR